MTTTTAAAVRQSFLDDILANPDDDAPRLILADWLDENSLDPADHCHAGLIRVQCELETLRGHIARCGKAGRWCDDCTREAVLSLREQDVRNSAGFNWLRVRECDRAELRWRRGFIEKVTCRLGEWMERGPRLVRRHPVRTVKVTDKKPYDRYHCWWKFGFSLVASAELPEGVWSLLSGYYHCNDSAKDYRSEAFATLHLSRACLDFARSSTV